MPVRQLNREQTWLLPPTLNDLIPADHPARFVAMVVDSLDAATWKKMEIKLEGEPLGAPNYHPRAMLGVWLYGFMTGTRASRKLEAACRDQIPYLWLTGWQHPDHNSLWRFYKAHREEMRHLFKMIIKTAVAMDLIDLAVQAIDGSKIAANAAKERTYDRDGLQKLLERTDKIIQELEKENEAGNDPVPVHLPEKLRQAEQLRAEVKAAMEVLAADEEKEDINLTDAEASLMKGRQGFVAGYNLEAVVSPLNVDKAGKSGLFVTAADVVDEPDDHGQLVPMLEQSEANTGKKTELSLADAGFHSGENLAECEEREQVIVMPEAQDRALKNPYHKDRFIYDGETDSYQCPCGHILRYACTKNGHKLPRRIYRGSGSICRECQAFGKCTKNKRNGRELEIGLYEAEIRRHRKWMATDEAKKAYERRKELIEPAFGIIKERMGIRRWLLRGHTNVRAEAKTVATAFNLRTLHSVWRSWTMEKRNQMAITFMETNSSLAAILNGLSNMVQETRSAL